MFPRELEETEPVVIRQPGMFSDTLFDVGVIDRRFFAELRDSKKIMGIRCPTCNRVYVPPRISCKKCFSELKEWVEVSDKGTLLTYTIVYEPGFHQPMEPPYAIGIILLDGADTGLVHCLGEVAPEQLRIGMRVQAVFKEEREGNILDIKYFKPL